MADDLSRNITTLLLALLVPPLLDLDSLKREIERDPELHPLVHSFSRGELISLPYSLVDSLLFLGHKLVLPQESI